MSAPDPSPPAVSKNRGFGLLACLFSLMLLSGVAAVFVIVNQRSSRKPPPKNVSPLIENGQDRDIVPESPQSVEALRNFHKSVIARLKEQHEQAMKEYRQQKAIYDKALADYQMAKSENDALTKLNLARMILAGKNVAGAEQRFREVMKEFPSSQAAKDAKILIDGGQVTPRMPLPEPVLPTMPVEPRPLELPPEL